MPNEKLTLVLTTIAVLLTAIPAGPQAAHATAVFVCGVLVAEVARRAPSERA